MVFQHGYSQPWHHHYRDEDLRDSWKRWEDLGAPPRGFKGTPTVSSWEANRLDCFVRGEDDRMWHKWYS